MSRLSNAGGYTSLEFKAEIWAEEIHLRLESCQQIDKAMRLFIYPLGGDPLEKRRGVGTKLGAQQC